MPRATMQVNWWFARWDGHCFECEGGIHRGEKVMRVGDQVAHLVCPQDKPVHVCPVCFLTVCDGHV